MKSSLVALVAVAAVTMFATLTTSPTPAQAQCGAVCQQKCKNSPDIGHYDYERMPAMRTDPETCMRIYADRNRMNRLLWTRYNRTKTVPQKDR